MLGVSEVPKPCKILGLSEILGLLGVIWLRELLQFLRIIPAMRAAEALGVSITPRRTWAPGMFGTQDSLGTHVVLGFSNVLWPHRLP